MMRVFKRFKTVCLERELMWLVDECYDVLAREASMFHNRSTTSYTKTQRNIINFLLEVIACENQIISPFKLQYSISVKAMFQSPKASSITYASNLDSGSRLLNGIVSVPRYPAVMIGTFTSTSNKYTADQPNGRVAPSG